MLSNSHGLCNETIINNRLFGASLSMIQAQQSVCMIHGVFAFEQYLDEGTNIGHVLLLQLLSWGVEGWLLGSFVCHESWQEGGKGAQLGYTLRQTAMSWCLQLQHAGCSTTNHPLCLQSGCWQAAGCDQVDGYVQVACPKWAVGFSA